MGSPSLAASPVPFNSTVAESATPSQAPVPRFPGGTVVAGIHPRVYRKFL